jgi:uncharacterized protein YfbU (UPF0304 family)
MARRKRDELEPYESELLNEIRAMFHALNASYDRLDDKSGINKEMIQFISFDANDPYESRLKRHYESINSHGQMLPYYKRLLEAWRRTPDKEYPSRDDLLRILEHAALPVA